MHYCLALQDHFTLALQAVGRSFNLSRVYTGCTSLLFKTSITALEHVQPVTEALWTSLNTLSSKTALGFSWVQSSISRAWASLFFNTAHCMGVLGGWVQRQDFIWAEIGSFFVTAGSLLALGGQSACSFFREALSSIHWCVAICIPKGIRLCMVVGSAASGVLADLFSNLLDDFGTLVLVSLLVMVLWAWLNKEYRHFANFVARLVCSDANLVEAAGEKQKTIHGLETMQKALVDERGHRAKLASDLLRAKYDIDMLTVQLKGKEARCSELAIELDDAETELLGLRFANKKLNRTAKVNSTRRS